MKVEIKPENIHFDIDMSDFLFELEWATPMKDLCYCKECEENFLQHHHDYLKAKQFRANNPKDND